MTHQEFQALLRTILQSFLNCIEGLQTQNNAVTEVTESTGFVVRGIRCNRLLIHPPRRLLALPSELTAIRDSLFDTLSSTIESANVLMSKVLSTRSEQHAKLELREFVEVFNECWSFVVHCEVTCKRMIVGLRGIVVSQVRVKQVSRNGTD
jgi:vacuolar protein sorting-associated protein 54